MDLKIKRSVRSMGMAVLKARVVPQHFSFCKITVGTPHIAAKAVRAAMKEQPQKGAASMALP